MLLPMTDCLLQHLKQSNYQAFVCSCALEAMQDLESLKGHGWTKDKELLVPLPITKALAPVSLLELMTCKCKTSTCQQNCSCSNTWLACTEGRFCMADKTMKHAGTHMVWRASVTQKKAMKRIALKSNCKIVDIWGVCV